MRIIRPEDFLTQPWKNGGGITHEIARAEDQGALLWRLSIAEVATDGPFSAFPGLSRILTVIDGAGIHLDTPDSRLDALPLAPLGFSGDLPVTSRLIAGPIRDFNVIFDGAKLGASVTLITGPRALPIPATPGARFALLALTPGLSLDQTVLPDGSLALFTRAALTATAPARGLLVQLTPR